MCTVHKKKADPQNCWDFWECPLDVRHKCPAFTLNAGDDCHNVAKDFCPRTKREFKNCWECPWYQKIKSR